MALHKEAPTPQPTALCELAAQKSQFGPCETNDVTNDPSGIDIYSRAMPFFADGFESGDTSAWEE